MKIYTVKEQVPAPSITSNDYDAAMDKYKRDVESLIRKNFKPNKYTGKIVKFAVADGTADYMMISTTKLIHMEYMDAYNYPMIERMTSSELLIHLKYQEKFTIKS